MSLRFCIFLCLLIFPLPVFAAGDSLDEESLLMENDRVRLLCNQVLTKGANYEAGTDVRGNQVVPADIATPIPMQTFYPIDIPIEIDVVEKFELDVPVGITLEPEVAGILVYEEGRVTYNGHDVSDDISKFCRKEVRHHKELHPEAAEGKESSGSDH